MSPDPDRVTAGVFPKCLTLDVWLCPMVFNVFRIKVMKVFERKACGHSPYLNKVTQNHQVEKVSPWRSFEDPSLRRLWIIWRLSSRTKLPLCIVETVNQGPRFTYVRKNNNLNFYLKAFSSRWVQLIIIFVVEECVDHFLSESISWWCLVLKYLCWRKKPKHWSYWQQRIITFFFLNHSNWLFSLSKY